MLVSDKTIHMAFRIKINSLKQNQLENIFIFPTYQYYTVGLMQVKCLWKFFFFK